MRRISLEKRTVITALSLAAAALLVMAPVLLLVAFVWVPSQLHLILINGTPREIYRLSILNPPREDSYGQTPGTCVEVTRIPPGGSREVCLPIKSEGHIRVVIWAETDCGIGMPIDNYVTPGMNQLEIVRIETTEDGKLRAKCVERRNLGRFGCR